MHFSLDSSNTTYFLLFPPKKSSNQEKKKKKKSPFSPKSLLHVSVHYSEHSGCVKFVFSDLSAELSEEALCLLKLPSRLHS